MWSLFANPVTLLYVVLSVPVLPCRGNSTRLASPLRDQRQNGFNVRSKESGQMSVAVAEGVEGGGGEAQAAGECLGSDDDDSSVMASLIAMFPSLDYEVIATVLQSHDGRLDVAVDYLMTVCRGEGGRSREEGPEVEAYHEIQREFEGQFSEDIGGLPELVPSFIYEPTEEELDGQFSEDIGGLPELLPSFIYEPIEVAEEEEEDDFDWLPSYEEACGPIEPGPPPYCSSVSELSATTIPSGEGGGQVGSEPVEIPAPVSITEDETTPSVGLAGEVGVQGEEEEGGERLGSDNDGLREQTGLQDSALEFSLARTQPSAPELRLRQQRPQALPSEDEDEEDWSYGDHSRHWTRLGSPTDELPNTTTATGRRSKKLRKKLAGKLGLRRTSKGDYKAEQERLETSAAAQSPPLPLRRLMDDDELNDR